MLDTGRWPDSWKHLVLQMLPRSWDTSRISNWRPTAMLDIASKIFAAVLHTRLNALLHAKPPHEQMGCLSRHSVDDACVALESIIEKIIDYNTPLYIASIGLRKASDSIEFDALLASLESQGIPEGYVCRSVEISLQQTDRFLAGFFFRCNGRSQARRPCASFSLTQRLRISCKGDRETGRRRVGPGLSACCRQAVQCMLCARLTPFPRLARRIDSYARFLGRGASARSCRGDQEQHHTSYHR